MGEPGCLRIAPSRRRTVLLRRVSGTMSALLLLPLLVYAQEEGSTNASPDEGFRPVRLKIGSLSPADKNFKDAAGNYLLHGSVSYDLPARRSDSPAILFLYLEGLRKKRRAGRSDRNVGESIEGVSAGLGARYFLTRQGQSARFYVGGGVGVSLLRAEIDDQGDGSDLSNTRVMVKREARATRISGKLLCGVLFKPGIFIELEYAMPGAINIQIEERGRYLGGTLNGLSTAVGFHF